MTRIDDEIEKGPHAWIQWKNTDACLDIHCACGEMTHLDEFFAYRVKCGSCGKEWRLQSNIQLTDVTHDDEGWMPPAKVTEVFSR